MVLACLAFYPAAKLESFPVFLVALIILATGITILQVAANPYVAILGKAQTASSRLNLTQAFNSLEPPYSHGLEPHLISNKRNRFDDGKRLRASRCSDQAVRLLFQYRAHSFGDSDWFVQSPQK